MQMLTVLPAAGRDFDENNDDNSGVVGPPMPRYCGDSRDSNCYYLALFAEL